jgi:plastocyanin
MGQQPPDSLATEVRVRLPLPIVIPIGALIVIGAAVFGFSRVLLAIPSEAATVVALATAANILGVCAVIALRPGLRGPVLIELILVALYPVLIGIVIAQTGFGTTAAEHAPAAAAKPQGGAAGAATTITAQNVAYSTDHLSMPADKKQDFSLVNKDATTHNFAVFKDEKVSTDPNNALVTSPDAAAGSTIDFSVGPLKAGEYYFHCDYHPTTMKGTLEVK